ncbi:MAG: molecular chaperone Hsp33 [Micavibrio aeruginosavorus]|uniref:Molecular chaperone Hsp33 n=1 Tax=Micavibrio aeruginosavorus TaxID=349221 RepID=A0A2W5N6X5_9BACT|nr:MAG: molecular chaperone Hsp33 [Micavibrio aeruginosavorus]
MDDNFVQSFQLESSHIRGRIVRLGSAIEAILNAHKYPDDVLHLTGETLALCVMLSSMLKYDGVFTLQTSGDGPVKMLVADMTSDGNIRACATYKHDEIDGAIYNTNRAELLGKGYMAFTVDQGEFAERYQGIVELKSESLTASVQHYFGQSEQLGTGMMMSVGKVDGKWRACGIMVQQMPEDTATYNKDQSNVNEDDWRRTMILLSSVKEEEMLSSEIKAEELLFRLFHEEGVRVYEQKPLQNKCRCSVDRVTGVLSTMSQEDIDEITVDGKIVMTCEFCSRDYEIDPATIEKGDAS